MAATMRDVADAAGVSIATVSFVINNTKPVTPATRQRIEKAVADLGFRPNMVARALASRRSRIIALAYPMLEHNVASATDFILSASRGASDAGYHLIVWPMYDDGHELAELVEQGLVDGVLLMEVKLDDPRVPILQGLGTPFALIGRTRDPSNLHYVDIDFDATMQTAIDHVTQLGHTRIVFVNGSEIDPSFTSYGPYVRAEASYRRLMDARQLEVVVLHSGRTAKAGRQSAREVLTAAPHATAVLIAEESAAAGLSAELQRRGRSVPRDMSVMAVMGSLDMAAMCNPSLTTITTPSAKMGRLGVKALIDQLEKGSSPVHALHVGKLAVGESTGPCPDPRVQPAK